MSGSASWVAGIAFELVDIELVVGEQDVVLEMLRIGRGVVAEPGQRVIDPLRGERGQRLRCRRIGQRSRMPLTMSSLVVDRSGTSNTSRRMKSTKAPSCGYVDRVIGHGEMDRDRRFRGADGDRLCRGSRISQGDLLRQVVPGTDRAG